VTFGHFHNSLLVRSSGNLPKGAYPWPGGKVTVEGEGWWLIPPRRLAVAEWHSGVPFVAIRCQGGQGTFSRAKHAVPLVERRAATWPHGLATRAGNGGSFRNAATVNELMAAAESGWAMGPTLDSQPPEEALQEVRANPQISRRSRSCAAIIPGFLFSRVQGKKRGGLAIAPKASWTGKDSQAARPVGRLFRPEKTSWVHNCQRVTTMGRS
jgi:hypothetical protein